MAGPEITRERVLQAFRERNPNLSKYTDDQIMTIIGQEAPTIIRHLVTSGDRDAARFSASPTQIVAGVQNAPKDISRLVPGGSELMAGYQPGPERGSLPNTPAPPRMQSPPLTGMGDVHMMEPKTPPTPPASVGMGDVQKSNSIPVTPITTPIGKVVQATDLEPMGKTVNETDLESSVDTSSHGASGGWEEPAKDYSQTPVLGQLARFGRGAVDAATTIAKAPGETAVAASTPQTPGEYKLPFVGLAAKRLLYEPTIENARAWWEDMKARAANTPDAPSFLQSAADAMGMVPLVGPLVKDLMETAGSGDIAGAVGKATTLGLAPKATEGVKEVIKGTDTYKYSQSRPLLITTPEGHLQTALKPDLDPQGLTLATQMLKEGEKRIGQPVKDIDTAKAAERAQFEKDLMPTRRSIIDPQKDVVLPGSRRQMIQAKIDAIPKDIQPGTPAYDDLVTSIRASVPKDLTIGELEDISSSLNSQNRGLHAAKFSQALTKMESANSAIDAATEFASRKLMQDGMDKFGRGGAEALRKVNERIGVGIKIRDAIDAAEKQARTEAVMPRLQRGVRGTTVNEGIANAMRTMKTKAPLIKPNLSPPMLTTGTDTSAVSAMTTRWEDLSPEEMAHLHQLGISSDVVRKMYAERLSNVNADTARRDSATGELLLPSHKVTPITTSTAGGDVTQLQHNGVTYGEGGVDTISGTQQQLQPTVIRPKTTRPSTPIFGESQHLAEGVPPGTKLAFKTKGLTGDMYHYETPDGRIITLDHELSPEVLKEIPASPYEAGTSHNRTPQPPKRSSAAPDKMDTGGEPASVSGPAPKRSSTIERPVDFRSTRTRIRGLTEPPKRSK